MSGKVTVRDVAEVAGVSIATVSMVMRGVGRISPDTRTKVLEHAERLGYRRDPRAVALREGRSRVVALVIASYRESAETKAFSGYWNSAINDCAFGLAERGYALVIVPPKHLDILERIAADLAIVADSAASENTNKRLEALGVPLLSGADGSGPGITIEIDYAGFMETIVRWLAARGCARPLLLAPQPGALIADANVDFLTKAWSANGVGELLVDQCGFGTHDIARAYTQGRARGCDGLVSLVAGADELASIVAACGFEMPGDMPTVIYEDPKATPGPNLAVATTSPSALGALIATAVADYLDGGRTRAVNVAVPSYLITT